MNDIKLMAVDLAKNIFQVCALDKHNNVLLIKKLSAISWLNLCRNKRHHRFIWKLVIPLTIGLANLTR